MSKINHRFERRKVSPYSLKRALIKLFLNPVFLRITVLGNSFILMGTLGFFYLEIGTNPHVRTAHDALWWALTTITTVGYGDVIPMTVYGRWLAMAMMIVGPALFWTYSALFAESLLSTEIEEMEKETLYDVQALSKDLALEFTKLRSEIAELKNQLNKR